jgi:hypothetical protein
VQEWLAWTRSYLMTDVRRTLHAKPLGVSKTRSAHPGQQVNEQERMRNKEIILASKCYVGKPAAQSWPSPPRATCS